MNDETIWAPWMGSDDLRFRPPVPGDAMCGLRWHEADPPPLSHLIESEFARTETVPWGQADTVRMIAGGADGTIIGGVILHRSWQAIDNIVITPSRELSAHHRSDLEGRILSALTPWLLEEVGVRSIVIHIAATRATLIEVAAHLGFDRAFTWREYLLQGGERIDLHGYQRLNPRWDLQTFQETDIQ